MPQKSRRRLPLLLAAAGLVVVLVVVIVVIVIAVQPQGSGSAKPSAQAVTQVLPAASTGERTIQASVTAVPDTSGIPGVLAWDTTGWPGNGSPHTGALEHTHVTGPVSYSILPPVGGPHNPIWMNAGTYTKPIPSERAVHNLEHGAVWITYNPDLPKSELTALTAFVARQSLIEEATASVGIPNDANRYIDLSPWATNSLPSAIVISAWGHQLRVTSPTDPRLQKFVNTFRHSKTYSPEFGAGVDGIPIETGGRAESNGGKQPNPDGAVSQ